jgi:hypothetical protein
MHQTLELHAIKPSMKPILVITDVGACHQRII